MARTLADVKAELNTQYLKARKHQDRSLALVTTEDPHDVFRLLREIAGVHSASLYLYRYHGLSRWDPQTGTLRSVAVGANQPDRLLNHLLESPEEGAIYVLEDFVQFLEDHEVRSRMMAVAAPGPTADAVQASRLIVLLDVRSAPQRLPDLLRSRIQVVSYPLPSARELERVVSEEWPEAADEQRSRMAASMAGMTMTRARECFREAALQGVHREGEVLRQLQAEKQRILQSELGLSLLSVQDAEEPLGLEGVWDYLDVHRGRIAITGSDRMKGLLFVGPPGSGKTMMARAIGRRLRLPVVNFEIGRLMNSYVGATENNVLRATAVIDSLAPVVVFIDEIEKALAGVDSGGQSDGGTMSRAYGTLLTWFNDTQAPVLLLATANHLHRLGDWATLTRSGRFDQLFFVDFPNQAARRQILVRCAAGHPSELTEAALDDLGARTEGFSGADLVATVQEAAASAAHSGRPLAADHLQAEVDMRADQAQTRRSEFSDLRAWAQAHCRPAHKRLLRPAPAGA